MRTWLLTNTTYGTWLPGDRRRSVLRTPDGSKLIEAQPRLERYARSLQKAPTVLLSLPQAELLVHQFRETATYRGWQLLAVSVMYNHFHLVMRVDGDPDPRKLLADMKAYGTRALNRAFGRPAGDNWWTLRGSKRKLPNERAVLAAVNYVLYKQPNPLVTWAPSDGQPKASAPGSGQPKASAPGSGQPKASAPGSGQPKASAPGSGQPKASAPGSAPKSSRR